MGRLLKVLVVDDNSFTALMTSRKVEEMGRPVTSLGDLDEALALLESDPPSLVILAGPLTFPVLAAMAARPHLESVARVCLIDDDAELFPCYEAGADLALMRPLEDPDWDLIVRLNA